MPCILKHDNNRSVNLDSCSCIPGYVGLDGGACSICPADTYKSGSNPGSCVACPTGASSAAGSGQVANCVCTVIGFELSNGVSCRACAAGKYKSEIGPGLCKDCEPGKYSSTEASTARVARPVRLQYTRDLQAVLAVFAQINVRERFCQHTSMFFRQELLPAVHNQRIIAKACDGTSPDGDCEDCFKNVLGSSENVTEDDKTLMHAVIVYKLFVPLLSIVWAILFFIQMMVTLWDMVGGIYSSLPFLANRAKASPPRAVARDILLVAAIIQIEYISIEDRFGFAKLASIFNYVQLWNLVLEAGCTLTTGRFFGELRSSQAYNVLVLVILSKALYTTESSKEVQVMGTVLLTFAAVPCIEVFVTENVRGRPHLLSFVIACCTTIVGSFVGQSQGGQDEIIHRMGFFFNGLETALSFLAASDVCPIGAFFSFVSEGEFRMTLLSILAVVFGVLPNVFDLMAPIYRIENGILFYNRTNACVFLVLNLLSSLILPLWWRECRLSFPQGHEIMTAEKETFLKKNKEWIRLYG
eukprot:768709-Hanusia_phi.AAC.1